MQAAMSMNVVPVSAPRVSKATLSRPAARSASFKARTVSNGAVTKAMQVWTPINNKFFETFSYLPPLTDDEIAKQVDYIVNNGFVPTLEFAQPEEAYAQNINNKNFGNGEPNYADNRYWTMWKLPMFGCSDPSQVLGEIRACETCFPESYIRIVAFDNVRQVQCAGFLVHRPKGASEFQKPGERSVS
jgi:ribulose-bisphosphate carboxylase small chain